MVIAPSVCTATGAGRKVLTVKTERLKTALAILGLTVLAVVAVDLLGRGASAIDGRFFNPPAIDGVSGMLDERQFAAAYDGAGYDVATLFREFHATERIVYEPYTVWDRRYYPGELISIDFEGFRRTTNNSDAEDALRVWVFGGSTAWGEGAPDDETIPSHLARLMNAWGVDTTIKNLGERGYVSTQEVVFLYRELQAGRRPDVVVFYDGINDAAAASNWPEVPGSHVSLHRIRDRFQFGEVPSERRREFVRSLGIYKASRIVLDRLEARERSARSRQDDADTDITPRFLDANFRFLGGQAVDVWLANRELVSALGVEFGFTSHVRPPTQPMDGWQAAPRLGEAHTCRAPRTASDDAHHGDAGGDVDHPRRAAEGRRAARPTSTTSATCSQRWKRRSTSTTFTPPVRGIASSRRRCSKG